MVISHKSFNIINNSKYISKMNHSQHFNSDSAIFQVYHGENKLNLQRYNDEVHFEIDQHA